MQLDIYIGYVQFSPRSGAIFFLLEMVRLHRFAIICKRFTWRQNTLFRPLSSTYCTYYISESEIALRTVYVLYVVVATPMMASMCFFFTDKR